MPSYGLGIWIRSPDRPQTVALTLDGELKAADFDLDLAGFDAAALEGLLADPPQPEAPDEFPEIDEDLPTEFQCPKCSYRWSGKPS